MGRWTGCIVRLVRCIVIGFSRFVAIVARYRACCKVFFKGGCIVVRSVHGNFCWRIFVFCCRDVVDDSTLATTRGGCGQIDSGVCLQQAVSHQSVESGERDWCDQWNLLGWCAVSAAAHSGWAVGWCHGVYPASGECRELQHSPVSLHSPPSKVHRAAMY